MIPLSISRWQIDTFLDVFWILYHFIYSYSGAYLQTDIVNEILESNIISKPFCSLITWLTNELGTLLKLDEQVCFFFILLANIY